MSIRRSSQLELVEVPAVPCQTYAMILRLLTRKQQETPMSTVKLMLVVNALY
jgi:hypothetical protein